MGTPVRLLDRVCIATTTGGTGSYALGAAPSGYLDPFVAGGASGDRVTYVVESEDRATWEECEGILTAGSPPTLSRARIIRNSSGGTSAVNWPSGTTKYITIVAVADRLPYLNTDGRVPLANIPLTVNLQAADWNGNFGLGTTAAEFVAIGAPSGARLLEIEASARLESGSTTACTVTMLARVYNAADTAVVAEYTLGQATVHTSNSRYVSFVGRAEHTFAASIPQQQIVRWLAVIDQPVSPISLYQLRGKIRAHLQA